MSDRPTGGRHRRRGGHNKSSASANTSAGGSLQTIPHGSTPSISTAACCGDIISSSSPSSTSSPTFPSLTDSHSTIPSSACSPQLPPPPLTSKSKVEGGNQQKTTPQEESSTTGGGVAGSDSASTAAQELDHMQRLHQRQKQILFGKATASYVNYLCEVPISRRDPANPNHPVTPRIDLRSTKRQFDASVRSWRRGLHVWDTDQSEQSCIDSSTESKNDERVNTTTTAGGGFSSCISRSSIASSSAAPPTRNSQCHPVLKASYRQSIRKAAMQLQAAVRAQFPSAVHPSHGLSGGGGSAAGGGGGSQHGGSNDDSASRSSNPAQSPAPSALEVQSTPGTCNSGGQQQHNFPSLPAVGGASTASNAEMTADFVCQWLQKFDDAAVNAESSLFSSEAPSDVHSSAFSVASSSGDNNEVATTGSVASTAGAGSNNIRGAGRRIVPVVKASDKLSQQQQQQQQHQRNNTSSNMSFHHNNNNGSRSNNNSRNNDAMRMHRSDDNTGTEDDVDEVDFMARIMANNNNNNSGDGTGGGHRPLKLSSLASSDTPSHLVLKMYEKQLPQIEFVEMALAGRSGSPTAMTQQHAARVQISPLPLNSRVSQWVTDHSPTPESEHHPLRSLHDPTS